MHLIYFRVGSVIVKYKNKLNLLGRLDDVRKH